MNTILMIILLIFTAGGCSRSHQELQELEEHKMAPGKTMTTQSTTIFTFDDTEPGSMPTGWTYQFEGKGPLGKWEVRNDNGNAVLAQVSSENSGSHFNLTVPEASNSTDVEVMVKFKGVAGEEDQGGGPVWRFQDADNYYIARANPLENNFRVYKVVRGRRKQLGSAGINIPSGQWHSIQIRMIGDHIECSYDGRKYLDVHDGTFAQNGKIGLWSKADAVTYFDDLQWRVLK